MAGVKQFEESSTAAVVISESVTKNNQIVKEIEEKIKVIRKRMRRKLVFNNTYNFFFLFNYDVL